MALPEVQDILAGFPGWATLTPDYGDISSGQGTGQTRMKSLRDMNWRLSVESRVLTPNEVRKWRGKLMTLKNGRGLFYGYDFTCFYPAAYPRGTWPTGGAFNGYSAKVHSIGSDGESLSLDHLPAAYQGREGDMLSITYGTESPPTDLALLAAGESFLANGSGITPEFAVSGSFPIAVAVGDVVAVKRPACHMMMAPDSLVIPKGVNARGVISFEAIQVPTP